jgi:hypothetical protein
MAQAFEVVVAVDVEHVVDHFMSVIVLLLEPFVEDVVVHLVDLWRQN